MTLDEAIRITVKQAVASELDDLRQAIASLKASIQDSQARGAFRSLAEIGCAVQLGMLAVYAARVMPGWMGPWPVPQPILMGVDRSLLHGLGADRR